MTNQSMNDQPSFPSRILALAEQAGGVPLAYREDDKVIVIVLTDGRKLTFEKLDKQYLYKYENEVPDGTQHNVNPSVLPENTPAEILTPQSRPVPRKVQKNPRKEKKANG